jgi:WD repeat-containing protein 55
LRVIELLPTRLVGVIADHGDFPIERIAIDHAGEGRWVGSVGHDEVLRLTDLREVLEDEDERDAKAEEDDGEGDTSGDEGDEGAQPDLSPAKSGTADGSGEEQESGDELDMPKPRKRGKKDEGDLKGRTQKKGRNQVDVDPSFFSGL